MNAYQEINFNELSLDELKQLQKRWLTEGQEFFDRLQCIGMYAGQQIYAHGYTSMQYALAITIDGVLTEMRISARSSDIVFAGNEFIKSQSVAVHLGPVQVAFMCSPATGADFFVPGEWTGYIDAIYKQVIAKIEARKDIANDLERQKLIVLLDKGTV